MKKIFALLLAMTLICGVAFALDGLAVGAEYRIWNFDPGDDIDLSTQMMMRLGVHYEGAFLDEALELEGELGFYMINFDDMTNDLDIEIEARYNLDLSPASRLTFILNSYTLIPFEDDFEVESWMTLGAKYKQEFGFGDMYFQVDVPFNLFDGYDPGFDAFDFVDLNFTISLFNERKDWGKVVDFPDGFGAELVMYNELAVPDPFEADFLQHLNITPFYSMNFWYAELEIGLPLYEDGMDFEGMFIKPKFEMDIPPVDGLSFWLDLPIRGLAADSDIFGDPVIGIGLGVNYNF